MCEEGVISLNMFEVTSVQHMIQYPCDHGRVCMLDICCSAVCNLQAPFLRKRCPCPVDLVCFSG